MLAANRAARIQSERSSRPSPSLAELQRAREQRALDRVRASDLGDLMSVASVYASEEVRIRQV